MSVSFLQKWVRGWRGGVVATVVVLLSLGIYWGRPYFRDPIVLLTTAERSIHLSPYLRIGANNEILGTDIDLAKHVARHLGRRLEIHDVPFNELLDRLEAGEGEFAVGMLSVTAERKKRFAVSAPYDTQGLAFVYRTGSPMPTMATAREFKIAVEIGTTGEEVLVRRNVPFFAYSTFDAAEAALQAGQVDAIFYDYQPIRALAADSGGDLAVGLLETCENYAILVRKDCPNVLAAANRVVAEAQQIGRVQGPCVLLLLAPLFGFLVVALPLAGLAFWVRRRQAWKVGVGMLHVLTALFAVTGIVSLVFVSFYIVDRYSSLLAEARTVAQSETRTCKIRLERYLEIFRDLTAYGRDSLQGLCDRKAEVKDANHMMAELSREACRRHPAFTGYYGVYNGKFVTSDYEGVGISWIPPADYNPFEREWYRAAKNVPGKIVSLPPYEDIATKKLVLTYATMLTNGVDCVGVDVVLQGLDRVIGRETFPTGETFVFSERGEALVHPLSMPDGNWQESKDCSRRDFFMKAAASVVGSKSFAMERDGGERIVAFVQRTNEGFLVVRAFREDALIGNTIKSFAVFCFVGVALFTLGCALALALVWGMRRMSRETIAGKNRELVSVFQSEAARTYFFSTVSHDIRTPLNAILGYSQLLKTGGENSEERTQALDAIVSSGKVLMQLVNDILDLSKLESGKMEFVAEPTDVMKLVKETAASFSLSCTQKGVDLQLDVSEMPALRLVPHRVRQILFNLLGNAVKFTDKGAIAVRASWNMGVFTLAVSDTGCGIAAKDLDRLMQPYVQVRETATAKGTGLGLAISKQLAERMGGSLSVTSELGKGTTFTLTLPHIAAASESPAGTPAAPLEIPSDLRTSAAVPRRILIVDDSPLNLKVLGAMLARLGVETVRCAGGGREALDGLRANPVDVVLSDLWMPEMDGSAFAAQLRKDERAMGRSPTPVFAVTADVEAVKKIKDMGFDGVLLKPVTIASLEGLLKSIGQSRSTR